MLNKADAVSVELKTMPWLQKQRWARRLRHYTFRCGCGAEFTVSSADIKKHSGLCKKCSRARTASIVSEATKRRVPAFHALYSRLKYNLDRLDQPLELTFEEFLEFTKIKTCHYCDCPIVWAERNLSYNGQRYNLDRKDNAIGYCKDNLVVACWNCNELKGCRLTYEEMVAAMNAISEVRRRSPPSGLRSALHSESVFNKPQRERDRARNCSARRRLHAREHIEQHRSSPEAHIAI
jgi:hypothetical protein